MANQDCRLFCFSRMNSANLSAASSKLVKAVMFSNVGSQFKVLHLHVIPV